MNKDSQDITDMIPRTLNIVEMPDDMSESQKEDFLKQTNAELLYEFGRCQKEMEVEVSRLFSKGRTCESPKEAAVRLRHSVTMGQVIRKALAEHLEKTSPKIAIELLHVDSVHIHVQSDAPTKPDKPE